MIAIKVSPEMGRGIYADRFIPAGTHIETCELLVFNSDDTKIVNGLTDLQYYTFKFDETQDCLVLGNGEIFNHDDKPNVLYSLADLDERKVMVFVTTRDVKFGEQLFIDYRADVKVNTTEYVNKNLVG